MTPRAVVVERSRFVWLAALVVGVLVALSLLAMTLVRWWLSPDAIEHLLIAKQWVHGSGFVVPGQWHHYLEPAPPHPSIWSHAPVISLLAALVRKSSAVVTSISLPISP